MRFLRSTLGCAALAAGAAAAAAAPPVRLTLEGAIADTLAHNRELAQGAYSVRQRELGIQMARTAFDMTAGPLLQVQRLDEGYRWSYGLEAAKRLPFGTQVGVSGLIADSDEEAGGFGERIVSVNVTQPLFRRFGRAANEEAVNIGDDHLRAERRRWEMQKADLVMRLVTLFETMACMDEQGAFETEYLERIEKLTLLVRARERQGYSTRVDVLRMDLQRGEAESRLTAVRERRGVGARELAEMTGRDLATEFVLEPPRTLDMELPAAEAAVATAMSNRLDIAQALDDAATAFRQGRLARRNRWPDLSIGLSMRRSDPLDTDASGLDGRTDWFATTAVGGYPWRTADRLAVQQAEVEQMSAAGVVEIRRQAVAREVLQTVAEYRRAGAELDIAERNRRLAQDRARLARRLYETGRGDSFSLSDAETQVAQSENRYFEARSACRLARYALLHAMGILIEHPADLRNPPEAQP